MQAPQRMHLSEVQNSVMPSRSERPLSTSTMCISPPSRGPRKCEVYCVIGEPSALRDSRRMNTARCSRRGMIFSMPIEAMCSFGTLADRSALPSLVQTTKLPVSATAKLAAGHAGVGGEDQRAGRLALRFRQVVHVAVAGVGADRPGEHLAPRRS